MSRREQLEEEGEEIVLPDCGAPFLVSRLLEIGPVLAGPLGTSPIGWRDLEAWQSCSAISLPPWQTRMIVELSREYAGFSVKAEKADCLAPWSDEARSGDRRAAIARGLRLGFKALMMKG